MGVAISYLISGVAVILNLVLNIFFFMTLARAILTWIPNLDLHQPVIVLLWRLTEPIHRPLRRLLPKLANYSGFDLVPLVILFGIYVIQKLVIENLHVLSAYLGA